MDSSLSIHHTPPAAAPRRPTETLNRQNSQLKERSQDWGAQKVQEHTRTSKAGPSEKAAASKAIDVHGHQGHGSWKLGMPAPKVKEPENLPAFIQSMEVMVGPDATSLLEKLIHPSATSAQSSDFPQPPKALATSLSVTPGEHAVGDPWMPATLEQKELGQALASTQLLSANKDMSQISMELTIKNAELFKTQLATGVKDAKNVASTQKSLTEKKIDSFKKQMAKMRDEAAKQMKSPIARFFLGIFKAVVGVVVGIFTLSPSSIISGFQSAAANFEMMNYDPKKGNYNEVMKKVSKIMTAVPSWVKAGLDILGAIGGVLLGGVSFVTSALKSVAGRVAKGADSIENAIENHAQAQAQAGLQKAADDNQTVQSDAQTRYQQLTQQVKNLADYLAQERSKSYSDAIQQGAELVRKSLEQKSQILSHRI